MCKAFSCSVNIEKKVTWKFGVDSHTDLVKLAGYKDQTADPAQMTFARVEITPDNNSYLKPDHWSLRVDESIIPAWLSPKHKEACFSAHTKWLAKLNKILIRKEIIHPFEITPPAITDEHVALLKKWDSVWDSVWAYQGSLFKLPTWKYIKHAKGKYPFQPSVDLWDAGLVPSFDGKTWRLHGGKKAAVLFEINADDLRKR